MAFVLTPGRGEPVYPVCCCAPVSDPALLCAPRFTAENRLRLDPEKVAGVVLCVSATALADVMLRVRRRGGAGVWLLGYPPLMRRPDGCFVFRFDAKMYELPPGRYEAQVTVKGEPCGSIEITVVRPCSAVLAVEPLEFHGQLDPELHAEVSDMYDSIATFATELVQPLAPDSTVLPLSPSAAAALCAATLCRPVELVLDDSVHRETVTFSGCVGGAVVVARGASGTAATAFPRGAQLRFVWTPANVQAACEGCP